MLSSPGKRLNLILCLLLVVAIFGAFYRVLTAEFTDYDDNLYVTQNFFVQRGLNTESVEWAFTAIYAATWQPLTWLSFMVDHELYSLRPAGYHLTNLLLHIANTLLLFGVLKQMTGSAERSAFVAGLFALHPLRVESVAWVAERKDVLSSFFWMLTMWAYVRYIQFPRIKTYIPVIIFFALGLMSKPMLVTVPFVLLLLDYWPIGRTLFSPYPSNLICTRLSNKRLIFEKVPLFVLSILSSIIAYIAQERGGALSSLDKIPLGIRLANAAVSYIAYVRQMIWPTDLGVLYPHPRDTIPVLQVIGAIFLLIFLSILVLKLTSRRPYIGVGWAWYLGTLVPVIGFVQIGAHAMADRFTYIPMIGLFVVIAWGLPELVGCIRIDGKKEELEKEQVSCFPYFRFSILPLTAIIVFIVCGICSWIQTGYWQNSTALFKRAVGVTHGNSIAMVNLAGVLIREGRINEAKAYLMRAVEIRPGARAYNNLGLVAEKEGKIDGAIGYFLEAIKYDPSYIGAYYNLANLFMQEGRIEEAVSYYKKAIALQPENPDVHVNLALALARQRKFGEAVEHYRKVLRINPNHIVAMRKLADILADRGESEEAIVLYRRLLRIKPSDAIIHLNLGSLLGEQGRLDEEILEYRKALEIKPDLAEAHNNLAVALYYKGEYAEAWKEARLSEKYGLKPPADFLKALSLKMSKQ